MHWLHWVCKLFSNNIEMDIMKDKMHTLFAKIVGLGQGTDAQQRIEAHVKSQTGGQKLSAYLMSGAADSEKEQLINELIAVIDSGKWETLTGGIPQGQVSAPASVENNAAAALFGGRDAKLPNVEVAPVPEPAAPAAPNVAAPAAKKGSKDEILSKLADLLSDLQPEVDESAIKAAARAELIGEIKPRLLEIARASAAIARDLKDMYDNLK